MATNPKQQAALKRIKANQIAETHAAFKHALDRLASGEAVHCDGRLIYENIWREAQLSRATLNRYPEYKDELNKIKANKGDVRSPDSVFEKNRELMEMFKQERAEKILYKKKFEKLSSSSAQEIYILNRKIEKLEQHVSRLLKAQPKPSAV